MNNQNSVFIRGEKDPNAFALCADALYSQDPWPKHSQ